MTFTLGDTRLKCRIESNSSYNIIPIFKESANNPAALEHYRSNLENLSRQKIVDFSFGLTMSLRCDNRLVKISYLKTAFLILFAWLGYRYAMNPRLENVRQQILNPQADTLGTTFWLESSEIPTGKIMEVQEPFPMLLVSFQGKAIILPNLSFSENTYDTLSKYWGKDSKIDINYKILSEWPDRLQMYLDYDTKEK